MDDDLLLTMTISRIIDEPPKTLDEQLLDTLRGLCSFKSCEDLTGFLFSEKLCSMMSEEPWLVFEIGLYLDHTKTIELIHHKDSVLIADAAMRGVFENEVQSFTQDTVITAALQAWISKVT